MPRASKKYWTPEETIALLECYNERKEEFLHSRKKKFAFERVLKDLIKRGVFDSTTKSTTLENKMHSLLKSYKSGKFNNSRELPITNYLKSIFGEGSTLINEPCDDDTMNSSGLSEEMINVKYMSGNSVESTEIEDHFSFETTTSGFFSELAIDIKPELPSRPSSPQPSIEPKQETETKKERDMEISLSREQFNAEKLKLCEQQFKAKMQQRRKYFDHMLQNAERRFREAEKAKAQRHREKMDLLKQLLLK